MPTFVHVSVCPPKHASILEIDKVRRERKHAHILVKCEFHRRGAGGRAILFGDPLLAAVPCVNSNDRHLPLAGGTKFSSQANEPILSLCLHPIPPQLSHCQAPVEELRGCFEEHLCIP